MEISGQRLDPAALSPRQKYSALDNRLGVPHSLSGPSDEQKYFFPLPGSKPRPSSPTYSLC